MVAISIEKIITPTGESLENKAVARKGLLFAVNSNNGHGIVMVIYIGLIKKRNSYNYFSLKSGSLDIQGQTHNFYPNQVVPIALWGIISQFKTYRTEKVRISKN